eukprot:scaffold7202_cov195-Cylindrotheca_fusiformis.AAC.1
MDESRDLIHHKSRLVPAPPLAMRFFWLVTIRCLAQMPSRRCNGHIFNGLGCGEVHRADTTSESFLPSFD